MSLRSFVQEHARELMPELFKVGFQGSAHAYIVKIFLQIIKVRNKCACSITDKCDVLVTL